MADTSTQDLYETGAGATKPVLGSGYYDNQQQPVLNPALSNPATRSIVGNNAANGTLNVDWEAEASKRIGAVTEAATQAGRAGLLPAMEASERLYQKSGKLQSSGAIYGEGGLMRTGEAYAANVASAVASGTASVYEQIGGERLQAEQIQSQERIAQLNANTQERIARIDADTTLTGFEKDIEKTKLINQNNIDIANITGKNELDQIAAQGSVSERLQQNEFNFRTDNGVKDWVASIDVQKYDIKQRTDLARDQLKEQIREFDMTSETDRVQFQKNLDYMYDALGVTEDRNAWEKQLAFDTLKESSRQYDLTRKDEMQRFTAQLREGARQFDLTKSQEMEIFRDGLREQARQFDITTSQQYEQWSQSFNESCRQYDLSRSDQLDMFKETLALQKTQTDSQVMADYISSIETILNDPAINEYLIGAGVDAANGMISTIFDYLGDGTMDNDAAFTQIINQIQTRQGTDWTIGYNGSRLAGGKVYQIRDLSGTWHDVDKDRYMEYKKARGEA